MPSITVTGLAASTSYDFRVAAANPAGTGIFSSTATASTSSSGSTPGQPQAIQTSSPSNTTITLSWTAPSSGGTPVTYVPQYKQSSSGTWLTYLVTTSAIDTAYPVSAFLSSLGVNTHLSYTQGTYGNGSGDLTALQYLGVKKIRDTWAYTSAGQTILNSLAINGIQATFFANSTISTVLNALAVLETAHPGIVLAIEGPNETNNFPISFNGQSSPLADIPYQAALYSAVKANSVLSAKPVYYYTGNYTAGTLAGLADYANGHPYPTGNNGGDQPSPRIDSEYTGHFSMPLSSYARVGTETGYTTVNGIDQATQAKNTLNSYLDAFKQGLKEIYPYQLLADLLPLGTDEGFGLFNNDFSPKPAATAIHNMTTILQDTGPSFGPGQLAYSLTNLPALGKSLLLQKSTGTYELVVWSETQNWNDSTHLPITVSPTSVTVNLGATFQTVNVYDPTSGTAPISTSSNVSSKVISVTDHPLIVEMIGLSSPVAIPAQPTMSQIFSSLAAGTSYDFRVFASNGSGSGPVSSVATALTTGGASLGTTFADEFTGSSVDFTKWNPFFNYAVGGIDYPTGGTIIWHVNPTASATSDPSLNPFSVSNSILNITIKPTPVAFSSAVDNNPYITGFICTQDKFSQLYGYFECSMQTFGSLGTLSAFWLLPTDGTDPPELDVQEVPGQTPTLSITTSHSIDGTNVANPPFQTMPFNMSLAQHTFGLDWTATTVTWYIDRVAVASGATPSDCHKPMYILVSAYAGNNTAWFADNGSYPNGSTQHMLVDYVRVWATKPF